MSNKKGVIEVPISVRANLALPIAGLVLFGGLGVFLLIVGLVKELSILPGLGLIILGLIFFVGIRAYAIELTATQLIYKELGRKREIRIDEIGGILITEGFTSFREMFAKPSVRIEVHHVSDESKNIYITSSIGIFRPRDIRQLLSSLSEKGISLNRKLIFALI